MSDHSCSVLVTGAAGFLGSHLVRALLCDPNYADAVIVAADDLSGGCAENLTDSDRVRFVRRSVTDAGDVNALFEQYQFRYVFHLAAYAAEGLSHFIRRYNYHTNLIGTVNLINACVLHETQHLMFTSSIAVYGSAQVPMREDMIPVPEDPYGVSKLAAELDLAAAAHQFGLNYTIFRPHNVYGEFQNIGDRYRNVVGIFMNRILQNQPLPVFGDGRQRRAFSYAGDLMPAFVSCPFIPEANRAVFNIGASVPTSVLDLAEAVCSEFGVKPELDFQPSRNEVIDAWSDHSRCREVFGDQPSTSLEDGLKKMASWVRSVGARTTPPFADIEIRRGLPPSWNDAAR